MLKTYENAQKSWTAKKKTMLTDGQATHLQDFITEYRAHGDFRRARGEVHEEVPTRASSRISTPEALRTFSVASHHAAERVACIHGNEVEESTEETARAGASDEHFSAERQGDSARSLARRKPPTSPRRARARTRVETMKIARYLSKTRKISTSITKRTRSSKRWRKTKRKKKKRQTTLTSRRRLTREDEDAKTDVPAPREPDAVHRSKVRRVSSPLDHLEDFYNEYKACKNFDLARGREASDSRRSRVSTRAMPTTISNRTVGES